MTRKVKDFDENEYILVQQDIESQEIQKEYCRMKNDFFTYLFVKLDESGADYNEIYGTDSVD